MRTLILDDAAVLRTVLATHVEALGGIVVGEAADLAVAMRDVAVLSPDVIFVDGRLPGGGPTAVAALHAIAPSATIIVIVALHETSLARQSLAAGAQDVLVRPYVRSRIAAALAAVNADV